MITQTRHMLVAAIESLEDELADRTADRDRLRIALRMLLDKSRAIPIAEDERGGTAGVGIYPERRELVYAVAALQGWDEGEGGVGAGG